jgi:hypothetical protein
MKNALKRGKGASGKAELYAIGGGMLGDAMGEAAHAKGIDAGRRWTEPMKGDMRVDMSEQEIRMLAWLSDIGFHHVISGGHLSNFDNAIDAERAANAVHLLEANVPRIEGVDDDDSRYDASWYRQTSNRLRASL